MEALVAKAVTLRSFLQSAAKQRAGARDNALEQNLSKETNEDITFALDHTFLILTGAESFPRPPWSCESCISHTELVHHVIEVLLARKRTINWEDADILTLGYREVAPEAAGHRVTQSNAVICYYPNTLVAVLKKPRWGSLHGLMGDDLMTHLLLNYTIIVQLKEDPGSYMQLTGKSLRQQKRQVVQGFSCTDKSELSINQAMYARSFQKDRIFASSHVLVKASKTGDPISRSEAARVLQAMFPEDAGKTRLPKRLINLIPTIQNMTARFKACRVEEFAEKLTPVNADFRKFMADNSSIKHKLAQRAADAKVPMILPIVRKALDDGYLSQGEEVAPSSSRKRKRREEAIETLSSVSVDALKTIPEESSHTQKKKKKPGSKAEVSDLEKLQQHKSDIQKLLAFSTPKKKIYRLVRKFVARVVPKELWGDSDAKNWKHVKEMLHKLIYSRKFDVLSLKKRAQELQVMNVKWMNIGSNEKFCPPNERVKRQKLFESLLWWLVSSLVFPLLRNLFYITEAEGIANEITYYQRPVWNVISTLALDGLEGGILQSSCNQTESSDRRLSTSLLRLLPKSSGVRPLMNLSTAVDPTKVSVNRSLEAVHRVLTFEMERQPKRLLGASVRNLDDIYKRLKPLFRQISSCSRCGERCGSSDAPMVYCVTVDVERCFDTIRPRKLYQLLKRAMQEEEYLIRKHWVGRQVAPILSAKSEEPLSSSSFFFKLERPAYPSGQLVGFDELAAQSSKKENALFVDGVVYDYLTKAKALELLKEHLSMNVVQVEGQEYVQQCGIPQGSVLSTTLCNMYYAHFERRVLRKSLPEICDPATVPTSCCQHEELFRYTDDFMYVTTDLKRARRFYKVMHEGNEDFGCFVNVAKSQANFEPESGLEDIPHASESCISWCGMLIDPTKLQVYVNYEKLGTPQLQHSIPSSETKAVRDFFVNKVISPVRQRWHALYFDPELLWVDSIHVNLFQTLLVAAHRFTILVEMLPFVNRDMTFFRECILLILKKMTKSIHRSLEIGMGSTNLPFQALKHQVWTIGFYAFQLVLQMKLDQLGGNVKRKKCQRADWQQLLDVVQVEKENIKLRAKRIQGTALDLGWLLKDQRNANVLKQFLHH